MTAHSISTARTRFRLHPQAASRRPAVAQRQRQRIHSSRSDRRDPAKHDGDGDLSKTYYQADESAYKAMLQQEIDAAQAAHEKMLAEEEKVFNAIIDGTGSLRDRLKKMWSDMANDALQSLDQLLFGAKKTFGGMAPGGSFGGAGTPGDNAQIQQATTELQNAGTSLQQGGQGLNQSAQALDQAAAALQRVGTAGTSANVNGTNLISP